MQKYFYSFLIAFSLMASPVMSASWGGNAIGDPITVKEKGLFDPLISIYNNLIDLTKNSIEKNMKKVIKSANILLSTMATLYIIFMGGRSLMTGSHFLSDFIQKMFLFLILSALLSFQWYDKYVLSNIETLFNNLPTLFSNGGGDIISNIVEQNSKSAKEIWDKASNIGFGLNIISWFIGFIAILALTTLTLVVLANILILTVEFYFVLSLSSILILLCFFKFTRNLTVGATQIVIGAILKITCLSLFLSLFAGVVRSALVFKDMGDFFSSCMGVVLVSFIGIVLIKIVNDIANRISGGLGQLAGANLPHLGNLMKNMKGGM
ncbi:MAG: type IV secretion system protein [Alphaproteobacteria bacterium]|jgi:hypothetical protein|nr:type IV secretion system protein [Alphaproteobacteria bacterium]